MRLPAFVRSIIQNTLHKCGYEIHRCHRDGETTAGALYEWVHPHATYSPWNADTDFLETYRDIHLHTRVDRYRCFDLWSLVGQSRKAEGSLIEVGVWRGGTGALIARRASLAGINAPVYLCDTFTGVVKASHRDTVYRGGEHADTTRQTVEALLDTLGISNVKILEGIFPEQTAHMIREDRFRFCHIDVDVYQSAKDILDWIWHRMSIGGIIVYDDYGFQQCSGITKHVEEQVHDPDRVILHNLNGHAVIIKIR